MKVYGKKSFVEHQLDAYSFIRYVTKCLRSMKFIPLVDQLKLLGCVKENFTWLGEDCFWEKMFEALVETQPAVAWLVATFTETSAKRLIPSSNYFANPEHVVQISCEISAGGEFNEASNSAQLNIAILSGEDEKSWSEGHLTSFLLAVYARGICDFEAETSDLVNYDEADQLMSTAMRNLRKQEVAKNLDFLSQMESILKFVTRDLVSRHLKSPYVRVKKLSFCLYREEGVLQAILPSKVAEADQQDLIAINITVNKDLSCGAIKLSKACLTCPKTLNYAPEQDAMRAPVKESVIKLPEPSSCSSQPVVVPVEQPALTFAVDQYEKQNPILTGEKGPEEFPLLQGDLLQLSLPAASLDFEIPPPVLSPIRDKSPPATTFFPLECSANIADDLLMSSECDDEPPSPHYQNLQNSCKEETVLVARKPEGSLTNSQYKKSLEVINDNPCKKQQEASAKLKNLPFSAALSTKSQQQHQQKKLKSSPLVVIASDDDEDDHRHHKSRENSSPKKAIKRPILKLDSANDLELLHNFTNKSQQREKAHCSAPDHPIFHRLSMADLTPTNLEREFFDSIIADATSEKSARLAEKLVEERVAMATLFTNGKEFLKKALFLADYEIRRCDAAVASLQLVQGAAQNLTIAVNKIAADVENRRTNLKELNQTIHENYTNKQTAKNKLLNAELPKKFRSWMNHCQNFSDTFSRNESVCFACALRRTSDTGSRSVGLGTLPAGVKQVFEDSDITCDEEQPKKKKKKRDSSPGPTKRKRTTPQPVGVSRNRKI